MHDAYRPISLLIALWPTQDFQSPEVVTELGDRLREQFSVFTEQRLSQPLPGIPPLEYPRLILLGEQGQWALELAPGKLCLRQAIPQPLALADLFAALRGVLMPLHAWLAENYDLRAYRLGLVIQFFCNTRSSANEKIAQYFLSPRALQGQTPYDVQLGVLSRLVLGEDHLSVNRWLRVRPLRTIDPRRVDFAAQIEVDINTLPEETTVKTARDLNEFLSSVCQHLDCEIPLLNDGEFVD